MGYGIRVVLVMNRKGGSGKSTLCRALASAAAARGETVTIFWMPTEWQKPSGRSTSSPTKSISS